MEKRKISYAITGLMALLVLFVFSQLFNIFNFGSLDNGATDVLGGVNATTTGEAYNIVGTRIGTTTTGVYFGTRATTTYPIRTGTETDIASFFIEVINASTTPDGNYGVSFSSSNDSYCETGLTAAHENIQFVNQIKWYDAGRHLLNLAGSIAKGNNNGTTTIDTTAQAGQNDEITLTNLASRCLRLEVSGSSTEIQIQMVKKSPLTGY